MILFNPQIEEATSNEQEKHAQNACPNTLD
jgi:hypothetical protein